MATIVTVVGSPSEQSRTVLVTDHFADHLRGEGHGVSHVIVRDLPAEELVRGRADHAAVAHAIGLIESAAGVVVATPVYKASFSGVLKIFLDVLPRLALSGKVVQPLATAASAAHVPTVEAALRTVLGALGAERIQPAYVDVASASMASELSANTRASLDETARGFARCLRAL